jgi:hypothetical protein
MSGMGIRKRWKRLGLAAGLVAIAWSGLGAAAQAAHAPARSETVPAGDKVTVTAQNTSQENSAPEIDDGKNCGQSRKRLFVEGEGWIVRRVTTCY